MQRPSSSLRMRTITLVSTVALIIGLGWFWSTSARRAKTGAAANARSASSVPSNFVTRDDGAQGDRGVEPAVFDLAVELCNFQWPEETAHPTSRVYQETSTPGFLQRDPLPQKCMLGVDQQTADCLDREPTWRHAAPVPWENFAFGEYIGPHRTPHLPVYLIRVGDQISFNYLLSRTRSSEPYRIGVADILQITSGGDPSINRESLQVLSDGSISLPLIGPVDAEGLTVTQLADKLNRLYIERKLVREPAITVQIVKGDIVINDLRDAVDARFGQGGQTIGAEVMPDGVVRLPLIGAVPAVGLTLDELAAEVNARYSKHVHGIFVTPNLVRSAPSAIFVLGEVNRSGRQELTGPTTVLQAIAAADGYRNGANLRHVVVLRRDQDWRLVATKLDLSGAIFGRSPYPSDEIWLRNGDIVIVPPMPILRFSRGVELYLTRSVYSVFPQQQLVFNFDSFQRF